MLRSCRPPSTNATTSLRRTSGVMNSGMLRVVVAQPFLKRRQLEEVALFRDALDLAAANLTASVDQLSIGHEDLVDGAVPPFVLALVDVPAIADPPPQRLRGRIVPRFGRPDEIVVGNIQQRGEVPELFRHLVGERLRRQTGPGRGALYLLAVLVRAGQEEDVVAEQPVRTGGGIRNHRRVGVTEMRLGVDVVDRRGDEIFAHDVLVRSRAGSARRRFSYASTASAWTSLTERLATAAR